MDYCYLKTKDGILVNDISSIIKDYPNVTFVLDEINTSDRLEATLLVLEPKDVFIINDFSSISKSIIQLESMLRLFKEKNIRLISFEDQIDTAKADYARVYDILLPVLEGSREIRSMNSKAILKDKKKQGVFLGRPKIDEEVRHRILYLRNEKKMSYRKIAQKMDVSLGSVHKYLNQPVDEGTSLSKETDN